MKIKISRHFIEVGNVSLFLSRDCFRMRIYKKGYVLYTLTLWDKYCPDTKGLYKGYKRIL